MANDFPELAADRLAGDRSESAAAFEPVEEALSRLEAFHERDLGVIEQRRANLAEVGDWMLRLRAALQDAPDAPMAGHVTVIPEALTASLIERLVDRSGIVRTSIVSVDEGVGLDEATVRAARARLARGLVQRGLYRHTLPETETGRLYMGAWAAAGESQRVTRADLTDFAVFGTEAVVTVSEWGSAEPPYVLIRHPLAVRAFAELFDVAWSSAVPPIDMDDQDDRLIALLGLGVKDEAIARQLGLGLRTVRRRVAQLMDARGVHTRFQLGVALEREGLVPTASARGGRGGAAAPR
ncbi:MULTISPECIES: hypothetical protein [unclassified Janibacter]|uniref:helix-turn-helix transcriptional regulator n=1 Tax=unclassified Janibacter TaxID=2649294 RepID=UPI003D061B6A